MIKSVRNFYHIPYTTYYLPPTKYYLQSTTYYLPRVACAYIDYKAIIRCMKKGFTIVELLVVIVVIAILAAITIVSFTGISQKAVAASL